MMQNTGKTAALTETAEKGKTPWWKQAVIYQIYPRSFCDSNGDGIGDLAGILSRLDYLEELGIDAIWLSPVFRSPQDDNGYDISDYCDIDPIFGTLEEMDTLIREAGKHGIRIIMDLVLNHTSDQHRWFLEAKKSRDNPFHDYYIWRDGDGTRPPNGLRASFGGSAWEWVPELGQYYFHAFSVRQPDLNWENPLLRQELYRMIRWWIRRGIGGFRLDVVDHLGKEPDREITSDGPKLHALIREMSREAFNEPELVTVGEAWSADTESAKRYSSPDGTELSMVFQFEHHLADQEAGKDKWHRIPVDFVRLKKILARWQQALSGCGWNSLFWENHDLPRSVSRFGDEGQFREVSAKMLAIVLHGMQGTPYIYQGEELGMTNIRLPLEEYRDIETRNMIRESREAGLPEAWIRESVFAISRDNARTPMQWDDSENAGFSSGTPWIPVNPNYREINAAEQRKRPDSVFSCYRTLNLLRKQYPVFADGTFRLLLEEDRQIFAYRRENAGTALLVLCNFSGERAANPLAAETAAGKLLISSYPDSGDPGVLRPYEAGIYLFERQKEE